MKKKWWLIAVALIIIAAGATVYGMSSKKTAQTTNTKVNTMTVKKGNLLVSVSGSGTVNPVNVESIRVLDAGQIKDVLVNQGDKVKKGQIIVTFSGNDNSDSIQQEELNLEKNQIDLKSAEKNLRNQSLESDVDTLKANIQKLQISIKQSQIKIHNYQEDEIPPNPIVSPIDGYLSTLSVDSGQQINNGSTIGTVTDYSDLEVTIQVDELDITKIKKGQTAQVTLDAFPNQLFTGTVTDIGEEGQSQNGVSVYDVTIHLKDPKNIKIGMTAETVIKVAEKNNVLVVPIEAVEQMRNKSFVLISTDSGTQRTPVEVGLHNENFIEITSGLKEEDQIVLPSSSQSQTNTNRQFSGFRAPGLGGGAGPGGNR